LIAPLLSPKHLLFVIAATLTMILGDWVMMMLTPDFSFGLSCDNEGRDEKRRAILKRNNKFLLVGYLGINSGLGGLKLGKLPTRKGAIWTPISRMYYCRFF
jgi:hypothetical protein